MSNGFGFDFDISRLFPDDPGGLTDFPISDPGGLTELPPFDPGGISEFPPDIPPPVIPDDFPGGQDVPPDIPPPSPVSPPPTPPVGQGPPAPPPGTSSAGGGTTPPPGAPPPQVDPLIKKIGNLLALLLAGGGVIGAGKDIFSKPDTTTTVTPNLTPQATQFLGGAQQQFGQTGSILQNLLGAIQNPQIPPGLSLLAEQAFQPRLGDLFTQATQAGRLRGFHDAPATAPPGGAILGPGLANLQGQMAQAKLNLFQNNIGNLLGALQGSQTLAGSQGQLGAALPAGRTIKTPPPTIVDTLGKLGPLLGGVGGILHAVNPPPPSAIDQAIAKLLPSLLSGLKNP